MAGTAKTDLLAVTITAPDQANAADAVGVNLKQLQEEAVQKILDATRLCKAIRSFLGATTARTNLDTAIASLG